MEFVAIDFETTGYENGGTNEPWQLGMAVVRDGRVAETREFFWRTTQQQEVDLVEESASDLRAFEFKWNPRKGDTPIPKTFRSAYPEAACRTITPQNVFEFL